MYKIFTLQHTETSVTSCDTIIIILDYFFGLVDLYLTGRWQRDGEDRGDDGSKGSQVGIRPTAAAATRTTEEN